MIDTQLRAVFVDDRSVDKQYMDRLARANESKIKWSFLTPEKNVEDFSDMLLAEKYDLIVLDYRLDEFPIHNSNHQIVNRYRAATLTQYLREKSIKNPETDLPIVVVSHEPNVHEYYDPDLTAHDLFDYVYLKKDINSSSNGIAQQLFSLIECYSKVRQFFESGQRSIDLVNILQLEPEEDAIIDFQEIQEIKKLFAPHQIVRCIYRIFVKQAGLLLSYEDMLARLGFSYQNSFDREKLEKILENKKIKYTGIFSSGWPRWWRHRFDAWMEETIGNDWGALTALDRTKKLNNALGLSFIPALSRITNDSNFLCAVRCISCDQPTALMHAVPSYESRRYLFLEKQRVCWACVSTGEYENRQIVLDVSANRTIERLKKSGF